MERPLEFAEGERQTAKRDVAVGPRIAETLGFGGEMGRHLRQQIGLIEIEGVAQLQLERAAKGFFPGQAEFKNRRWVAIEGGALGDGDEIQAGFCCCAFERCDD